ncbi:MAG: transporter substrate-binding domain-containing protein [Betaproteobacteria bacterium]|nr:transporter substrate-binding domain-containing protein [Betaproteobacteria bacterium]
MTMSLPPITPAVLSALAPTGKLRAGINFQNPLLTKLGPNGEQSGVAVDLVHELAKRLNVPIEVIVYHSAGELAESVASGKWDVSVLAVEAERAKDIAFAGATTEIEATYMVPPGSKLQKVEDVDSPGVRIALGAKSGYDLYLARTLKHAQRVPIAGSGAAFKHFVDNKLDAYAGLKTEMVKFAAQLPGARLLDGRFMTVCHTAGVPRGRGAAGESFLNAFVEAVKAEGLVQQWINKSGVAGLSAAPLTGQ